MADVKWIKITTDIFDDEKIILIESMPDCYAIITVWFKLLCLAGKQNNKGVFMLNDRIAYTDKMLATIFRMNEATVTMAIQTFQQFGMIEIIDGIITIPNWDKHQSLDAYEKKKERDRQYQAERRATQKAIAEKSSDKSSDIAVTEEEREKEGEEDKEYHSFIHSAENDEEFLDKDERREALLSQQRTALNGPLGGGVVFLSDEQMDDLLNKLSLDEFHYYIGIVRDCELKGKSYKKKTHYQAILDMAIKDRKVK